MSTVRPAIKAPNPQDTKPGVIQDLGPRSLRLGHNEAQAKEILRSCDRLRRQTALLFYGRRSHETDTGACQRQSTAA